ncbi:MAG: hypothetical protein KJ896_00875 [Nanoarchaeota archaeon]|nr:hypothetical protein [Nanoarchaeota archaeon]
MKSKTYIILIVVLIFLALLFLIKNYNENIIGDSGGESLELENLKVCCEYLDENGETKSCSILNDPRYDCEKLCSSRCS